MDLHEVQTKLLQYGVSMAPATHIWKVCQQCLIIQTDPNPEEKLDWGWINSVID